MLESLARLRQGHSWEENTLPSNGRAYLRSIIKTPNDEHPFTRFGTGMSGKQDIGPWSVNRKDSVQLHPQSLALRLQAALWRIYRWRRPRKPSGEPSTPINDLRPHLPRNMADSIIPRTDASAGSTAGPRSDSKSSVQVAVILGPHEDTHAPDIQAFCNMLERHKDSIDSRVTGARGDSTALPISHIESAISELDPDLETNLFIHGDGRPFQLSTDDERTLALAANVDSCRTINSASVIVDGSKCRTDDWIPIQAIAEIASKHLRSSCQVIFLSANSPLAGKSISAWPEGTAMLCPFNNDCGSTTSGAFSPAKSLADKWVSRRGAPSVQDFSAETIMKEHCGHFGDTKIFRTGSVTSDGAQTKDGGPGGAVLNNQDSHLVGPEGDIFFRDNKGSPSVHSTRANTPDTSDSE